MRYPNFPDKHAEDSMIDPQQYLEYMRTRAKYPSFAPPKGVILCYQRSLLAHIKKEHPAVACDGFLSELLFLTETNNKVAVMGGFGIGAPGASVVLEELIAFGVTEFISIGTAGALQKDIEIGELVVCDRAIRDEGTSHHYLPTSKYVYPSKSLTERLCTSLKRLGREFRQGTSWTIDAPYRETLAEARSYQEEGVATVEMEASALFAVASYRKVSLATVFTISDSLAELKWNPGFHNTKTMDGLETIYKAAVASF